MDKRKKEIRRKKQRDQKKKKKEIRKKRNQKKKREVRRKIKGRRLVAFLFVNQILSVKVFIPPRVLRSISKREKKK